MTVFAWRHQLPPCHKCGGPVRETESMMRICVRCNKPADFCMCIINVLLARRPSDGGGMIPR